MATGKRRGRGEGSIEELPGGKFRAVLSAGFDGEGKRRKLTFTANTKRDALAWLRERLSESSRGELATSGRMTLADWLRQWLEMKKAKVSSGTHDHDAWRVDNRIVPMIGQLPIGKLSALEIETFLGKMAGNGDSTSEVFKAGSILRAALASAVRLKLIPHNVAKDAKLPKVIRPAKVCLDRDQAATLLRTALASTHRLRAVIDLALDTGMRPGEWFGLHWPDVNLEESWVFVRQSLDERKGVHKLKEPKTTKGKRRIQIAPRTTAALRSHRERMEKAGRDVERGLVFCDRAGGFLRRSNFLRRFFKPLLVASGLPMIRPYDLRHASATLLLAADVNVRVVSERMGHESIELTLQHYSHALPSMQERAAAAVESMFGEIVPQLSQKQGKGKGGELT